VYLLNARIEIDYIMSYAKLISHLKNYQEGKNNQVNQTWWAARKVLTVLRACSFI